MRKSFKIAMLLAILFFSLVFLLLGGSFFLHKAIAGEQDSNLTYFQTMKALFTLNAEQDLEKQIKESYLQEDYHHVSIYYEEDFTELLPIAKETLDLAIAKTEALFGKTSQEPIDFLVFKNSEEMSKMSGTEGGAGFYSEFDKVLAINYIGKDLKDPILEGDETALYIFQEAILHEYTHYVFNRKAPEQDIYPFWFIEGVAEYAEDEGQGAPLPAFELIPFAQLTTHEQWQEARNIPSTHHYAQSYYAIKCLVDQYGEGVIKEIMDSANETKDFEKSIEKVTGLTISEFEAIFRTSLKK